MLVDCHVHTTRYSACSAMEPRAACARARAGGIDCLVFTEHHHTWNPAELAALDCAEPALVSGVEVSLAEGYDVVVIGPTPLPPLSAFTPLKTLSRRLAPIREDCFLFVAHPFRYSDRTSRQLVKVMEYVDGIEVNSVNILRSGWMETNGLVHPANHDRYLEASERFELTPLFNTDSHHENALGLIANEIPGPPPKDAAELAARLKSGPAPSQRQNAQGLAALLA